MDAGTGVVEGAPLLATYPDCHIRNSLPPEEWQACLEVWLLSLEYRLRLKDDQLSRLLRIPAKGDLNFLKSYFVTPQGTQLTPVLSASESQLHKWTYLLLRRFVLNTHLITDGGPQFIVDYIIAACPAFHKFGDWPKLLASVSEKFPKQFAAGFDIWKAQWPKDSSTRGKEVPAVEGLRTMNMMLRVYVDSGVKLMAGSDYLEAVIDVYQRLLRYPNQSVLRQTIIEHLFLCLRSLMSDKTRHPSLLLDQLYILRADTDKLGQRKVENKTLLSGLICTTSFLRHLSGDMAVMDTKRGRDMVDALLAYREQTKQLFPAPTMRTSKVDKGKGKAKANDQEEMHIHQAAQVSQIHELFPDLSDEYIMRILDHSGNDVETATASLLEPSSLPASLQDPNAAPEPSAPQQQPHPKLSQPQHTQRQSKFDNDDFSRLAISSAQLHKGRRKLTISDPVQPDEKNRSKAAILAALSAFDTDDDERDDTYDVTDVGGSIDQSVDTDNRPKAGQNPHEEVLYRAWKGNTTAFARDSKTRMSPHRQDLKRQTGMGDEQIEGWAIMLARDLALQRRLEQKYAAASTFRGNQLNVEATSWRQSRSGESSIDESEDQRQDTGDESGPGEASAAAVGARGRGRGRGGVFGGSGRGSGQQSGSERGRGRGRGRGGRANHNRREGRAKKMGRGMAGAPAS